MKSTVLFFVAVAALFLCSCKKQHSPNPSPSTVKYPVRFNVADFMQVFALNRGSANNNSKPLAATTSISGLAKMLYFYVYDSNNAQVEKIIQDSTYKNFGSISDSLPSGTYKVAIIAGQGGLNTLTGVSHGNVDEGNLSYSTSNRYWNDTFLKVFPLTISTSPINQTVTLDRINAELELQLKDILPANAKSIYIYVSDEFLVYNFLTGTYDSNSEGSINYTTPIPTSAIGKSNFTIDHILLNTINSFSVNIICYDDSKNILAQKTVKNVACQKNTKTILSGNLFSSNSTSQITTNTTWDNSTTTVHF